MSAALAAFCDQCAKGVAARNGVPCMSQNCLAVFCAIVSTTEASLAAHSAVCTAGWPCLRSLASQWQHRCDFRASRFLMLSRLLWCMLLLVSTNTDASVMLYERQIPRGLTLLI